MIPAMEAGDIAARVIPPEVLRLVPFETARRCQLIPFELKAGKLLVASARPEDFSAMDDVGILTGHELEVYEISAQALEDALRRHYAQDACCSAIPALASAGEGGASVADGGRVVAAVDALLSVAVERGASDIHLEPQKERLYVRLRVDGILNTVHAFPRSAQSAVLSRVKIMAGMDIAERRLPQDGQASFRAGPRDMDLRVSTLPGKYGEKIVVRILDKSGGALGLDRLGFDPATQGLLEAMIEAPHGIILVTGPTGSGKTTTLYSILRRLRSPLKNIITLEDPIE
ncbi:MAG: Flp pilus assembly complex ATPase component TadA, partial [Elusimicrobia bacterium]|nr:Flp pilus assembly complex ATPase component TadA [Elusimicrobiota bacterium]